MGQSSNNILWNNVILVQQISVFLLSTPQKKLAFNASISPFPVSTLFTTKLCSSSIKEEEYIPHSWCWTGSCDLVWPIEMTVCYSQPIWFKGLYDSFCSVPPVSLPWGHAWASLLKDERHVEQSQVTPFVPDKASLDQPIASQPQDMWLSPAKNSRSAWPTPSWPQRGEQYALTVACHCGFVVACHASCSITEAIDNWCSVEASTTDLESIISIFISKS